MSTPQKSQSGGGPSIRLSVPSRSSTPPSNNNNSSPSKKRRFVPPAASTSRPKTAQAHNLKLLHQKSSLSFVLHRSSPTAEPTWHAEGVTSLYLLDESSSSASTTAAAAATEANGSSNNNNTPLSLALHLRGTAQVTSVQVESASSSSSASPSKLAPLSCSYQHLDPLERVLLKPATSFTMDDVISTTKRQEADSQCSRGATGMTNALRAASIASTMGELRIFTTKSPPTPSAQDSSSPECWKQDLRQALSQGETVTRLKERLEPRVSQRKSSRIDLVANALGAAGKKALKVTVRYSLLLGGANGTDFGGIHASTSNQTPHVYTTAGVYGDHEGPRSWIPTLESASTKHRASQDITIKLTAPMSEGLSVVGFGEDYGAMDTMLHDPITIIDGSQPPVVEGTISQELGQDYVAYVHRILNSESAEDANAPHIIPPESNQITSMDSILATSVWTSCSWLPIPARALGFAIGPFRVLEDPEYFKAVDEDDASEEAEEAREALEAARENGEGIRQVYFAPIFCRRHIHATANTKLIPNTRFQLSPLTARQAELLDGLDQSVLTVTVGVTLRALSLMRDILALPSFRTVSYTQIWIPHAVHGGSTSGALNCCPEVRVNPFLGGAIMDARLLPPVGHRLPYHQGGRVLQFLQARCVVRGWIISAIPLGGRDDVGQGYIHTLIESLIMSLYERGHGAHGEGTCSMKIATWHFASSAFGLSRYIY
jgi:hypothetical protein